MKEAREFLTVLTIAFSVLGTVGMSYYEPTNGSLPKPAAFVVGLTFLLLAIVSAVLACAWRE